MMSRHPAPRTETANAEAARADTVETAMAELDAAKEELARLRAAGAPLPERRAGWQRLDRAFAAADRPLRSLAAAAKGARYGKGSYLRWADRRHRLSQLNLDRQRHLFAHSDDLAALEPGTVRALDTGMSGPSLGELQHGESVPPGTAPTYGLDLPVAMSTAEQNRPGPAAGYRLMTPAARPRLTTGPARPVSIAPVTPTPVTRAPAEQPARRPGPTLPDAA
jgi:hypothetical protein